MRQLVYFILELLVGVGNAGFVGIVRFPEYSHSIGLCLQVSIYTIFGDVQLCALKPFCFCCFEVPFQYFIPWFFPMEVLGDIGPKIFWIFYAPSILFLVFFPVLNLVGIGLHDNKSTKLRVGMCSMYGVLQLILKNMDA